MLSIYKASAGSGKTFTLTLEYFKIIFEMPTEYRNILAVTFTNKATEEMKSRIINELYKLADGQDTDYGKILCHELNMNAPALQNRAKLLLSLLLHDYGRLAVTTIDKFFQRIIKSFIHELGIFPGYNVELDNEFVLLKAVDKVMEQIKDNADLRNWIYELLNDSIEEGKSWSVKNKIADLGQELFRENYMLFNQQVLDKFSDKHFLKAYRKFLDLQIKSFEDELQLTAKQAVDLIDQNGLNIDSFKKGKSGCVGWFYKLSAGNFDQPTPTTRKGAEFEDTWIAQKSPDRANIENILPDLMSLLQRALAYYDTHSRKYLSAIQLIGNLYQLGILNDLYQEVRSYCNAKGLMLLSDTTHILNKLISNNDTSFLFEKCGNYYKYIMIDEFQDTSAMQWKNFRPLIVNSLSENCKAMIVGDVKQSIYRWRNGEWSLLAYEVEQQFKNLGMQNVYLSNNWRSAKEIVEFNNEFFEAASNLLARNYRQEVGEEDERALVIQEAYKSLRQTPRKQKCGYVDILYSPEKKEEDSEATIIADVINVIGNIRERGGRLKDIVILVRNGKEGASIAEYLMEYNKTADTPVSFISNDSLYVWSSPYVQFIVAVLRYIVEPFDLVNKAQIIYFYKTFVQHDSNVSLHEIFNSSSETDIFTFLETTFNPSAESVMSYSLFETIETIIEHFNLQDKEEEIPYLIALQDIIYEYEANNSNSITLFLEWWEKEQGKRVLSTSEEVDAVRILTIHKSKGLEFEYVILPFCSWELDGVRPIRRIWCKNNEQDFNQLEYAPLNYSSKLIDTSYREDYMDEHLKAYIDNLNLLYVALTRPKVELYIRPYSPKVNKDGSISLSDIGAFMYLVLEDMGVEIASCGKYVLGEQKILGNKSNAEEIRSFSLQKYPVWQSADRINVKYLYRDYTAPEESGLSAINEGKLLHEMFKTICNITDVEQAVAQAYLNGLIRNEEKDEYITKIQDYLKIPQASEWFHPKNKIINERDILFPGGNKARPDRIVERNDKVIVIDYKFGQSEEIKYIKQVRFYCKTLREMGYPQVEGYIWYVKLGKIINV